MEEWNVAQTEKITLKPNAVKKLMDFFNENTPEEAIERYAFKVFDLKHNASICLGKVTKTSFEIIELP